MFQTTHGNKNEMSLKRSVELQIPPFAEIPSFVVCKNSTISGSVEIWPDAEILSSVKIVKIPPSVETVKIPPSAEIPPHS